MPRKFTKYLQPYNIFSCSHCNTHIASLSDMVSKSCLPTDNTSYLFHKIVNVRQQNAENKKLLSGESQIADLYCGSCGGGKEREPLGWRYVRVGDQKMKFKEGLSVVQKKWVKKVQWIK